MLYDVSMKKNFFLIPLFSLLATSCNVPASRSLPPADQFEFSIVWGVYGKSSYDSKTKKLVKTTDVETRDPSDYVTEYVYPKKEELRADLGRIDIYSYPDEFDPYTDILGGRMHSNPYVDLKFSIEGKTVHCAECPLSVGIPDNLPQKSKNFLTLFFDCVDTITASEEWKALPDYEVLYL